MKIGYLFISRVGDEIIVGVSDHISPEIGTTHELAQLSLKKGDFYHRIDGKLIERKVSDAP